MTHLSPTQNPDTHLPAPEHADTHLSAPEHPHGKPAGTLLADPENRKIGVLAILVAVLALVYTGSLVFDPARVSARQAQYTWLDPARADQAGRIEMTGASGTVTLVRHEGSWQVQSGTAVYPAKQSRVADMLRLVSTTGAFPLRSTAADSYARLGVAQDAPAGRLVITTAGSGDQGTVAATGAGETEKPLLDLIAGNADATGREIYLRNADQTEVRSGENTIAGYLNGTEASWCDLRLFPQEIQPREVQAVVVTGAPAALDAAAPGAEAGAAPAPFTLRRTGTAWTITGADGTSGGADTAKVEAYLRGILSAEGEALIPPTLPKGEEGEEGKEGEKGKKGENDQGEKIIGEINPNEAYNQGRIVLELGNGTSRSITLAPAAEPHRWNATVPPAPYRYIVSEWAVKRWFIPAADLAAPLGAAHKEE